MGKPRRVTTITTTTREGGGGNDDEIGEEKEDSSLEFIEQHPMIDSTTNHETYVQNQDRDVNHGAWTIGLRETSMTMSSSDRRKRVEEGKQQQQQQQQYSKKDDHDPDIDTTNNLEMFIN